VATGPRSCRPGRVSRTELTQGLARSHVHRLTLSGIGLYYVVVNGCLLCVAGEPAGQPKQLGRKYLRTFIKKPAGGGADSPLRRVSCEQTPVDLRPWPRHVSVVKDPVNHQSHPAPFRGRRRPPCASYRLPLALIAGPCALESPGRMALEWRAPSRIAALSSLGLVDYSFDRRTAPASEAARAVGPIRRSTSSPRSADRPAGSHRRATRRACERRAAWRSTSADSCIPVPPYPIFWSPPPDRVHHNVNKGQFPRALGHGERRRKLPVAATKLLVTERGVSFGYNTLVSDMRALPIMVRIGAP